jgi:uncharacterized NAD(P)/FAD-binding protein YdhS
MKNIAIIGAGLSGTLLAMNLLRQPCNDAVHIKLIDRNSEDDLGPAYSTDEDYLLNVPVEIMGAVSQDPEHFLNWLRSKKIAAERGDYLPRKVYRRYIQEMLQRARQEKKDNRTLQRIRGEALDLTVTGRQARISVRNQDDFSADKVVLALGNSPPQNPGLKNRSFVQSKKYIQNPWHPDIFTRFSPDDTILFIGTGQTMVDLATGLYRKKHKGKLLAISRRGILPLSQKMVDPYPSFFNELQGHSRILPIFKIIRKHLDLALQNGLDARAVIDSLRPHTAAIWMQLPPVEKRRFLRHIFRYWEIIRSRIPPESDRIIRELRSSGQLKILSGKMVDLTPKEDLMVMHYIERDSNIEKTESTHLVINCMGPNLDYEKREQTLIKNLILKKLIQCDPVHLGINALPDGSVITETGKPSDILYTIGLTLKGIVWEALATPEIRVQAENLARILLSDSNSSA